MMVALRTLAASPDTPEFALFISRMRIIIVKNRNLVMCFHIRKMRFHINNASTNGLAQGRRNEHTALALATPYPAGKA